MSHIWKLSFPSEPCPVDSARTGGDGREASVPLFPQSWRPASQEQAGAGLCLRGSVSGVGGLFWLRVCVCILGRLCICPPGAEDPSEGQALGPGCHHIPS